MLTDQNLIAILVACIILLTGAFSFLFEKLKKAYQKHLKVLEEELGTTKHSFGSLLTEKKKQHQELKDLKFTLAKADSVNEARDNNHADVKKSLENCRAILELVGRVGTVHNDFWKSYCKKSYEMAITSYIQTLAPKITLLATEQANNNRTAKGKLDLERNKVQIEKMRIALNNISFKIVNKTEILQNLVDEMFYMADTYYAQREEYFISSGPAPKAVIDKDLLNGTNLKQLLNSILKEENFNDAQIKVMEFHLNEILLFPLVNLERAINENFMEKLLADTGYFAIDLNITEANVVICFTIPVLARKQVTEKSKAFTSNFLNILK